MSTKRCPSMEQTSEGLSTTKGLAGNLTVSSVDRDVLRTLANEVAELASLRLEKEKKKRWIAHNDLRGVEPMVFIDPENGWNEIITQERILCTNPLLRVWEMAMRKEIFWVKEMKDDRVIESCFNVPYSYEDTGWGFVEKIYGDPESGGSYVWDSPITNYAKDLQKLKFPVIRVNYEATNRVMETALELFDDILTVRLRGVWWWSLGMTYEFIKLRGLTNFMMDMYDNPDNIHRLMTFLRDGTLKKLDFLEENRLLALNTEGSYVGSGGFGWTEQLPQTGFNPEKICTIDMWGFAESQETAGVSPEMFAEFILPYQKDILDRFGLNCYGCCEPIDSRWDYVKTLPRLRRISSSPWADKQKMAELLGRNYILSVKPNPTYLARPVLEQDEARKELRDILEATKGGIVELIMKDNHTLGKNPGNATRWVEIAREEIGRVYG